MDIIWVILKCYREKQPTNKDKKKATVKVRKEWQQDKRRFVPLGIINLTLVSRMFIPTEDVLTTGGEISRTLTLKVSEQGI